MPSSKTSGTAITMPKSEQKVAKTPKNQQLFTQKQSKMSTKISKAPQSITGNHNFTVLLGATWQETANYKFPKALVVTCQVLPWWTKISLNTE